MTTGLYEGGSGHCRRMIIPPSLLPGAVIGAGPPVLQNFLGEERHVSWYRHTVQELVDAPLQFCEETRGDRPSGCEPDGESSEGDS